jgi:bleomycin hydrolase
MDGVSVAQVQKHDKAVTVESRNEFLDSLTRQADLFATKVQPVKRVLRMDFSTVQAPDSVRQFAGSWHNPPISQGLSGMCWCFSATSFFESEIYRLTRRQVKLSELYTVYWEYVEKTRRFVKERGNSAFGEGSEANAVPRIWKEYGIVPGDAYTGLRPGQKVHDHRALFAEMNSYLQSLKQSSSWSEEQAVATVRAILNHYLGEPPSKVLVAGNSVTPGEYLKSLPLDLDRYVEIMSLMQKPFYEKVELEVPDNWWHSKDYLNVPLDEFMSIIKRAVRKGYSVAIGGDVSEPGYEGHAGVGVVPTFDIPSAFIDESARQFRFSIGNTADDHGIHIVGYMEKEGKDWYLIKDSGSGSRNNNHPGYYFYQEDYVKLKMLSFTVPRDLVEDLLRKVKG